MLHRLLLEQLPAGEELLGRWQEDAFPSQKGAFPALFLPAQPCCALQSGRGVLGLGILSVRGHLNANQAFNSSEFGGRFPEPGSEAVVKQEGEVPTCPSLAGKPPRVVPRACGTQSIFPAGLKLPHPNPLPAVWELGGSCPCNLR